MATKREGVAARDSHRSPTPRTGSVRVWGECSLTLAITDDPPQFLKVTFGHERLAKNDTQAEIRKTAALIDEFNEAEIARRIEQYRQLIEAEGAQSGSVRERARKRMGGRK